MARILGRGRHSAVGMGYSGRVQLPDRRPEIDYPTLWSYQVIGSDEARVRGAVAEVVLEREHTLRLTKTSRTGKYCSLLLELVVVDEADRLALFEALAAHDDVRIVL
jgi:putative lipoic acid-binding regulatory protein